jgi:gliding-associated putative ABC transporter substrate-binding component GldG
MKRRSKHAAAAITATALLLGILLVVNLISTQIFTRLDLTEGKVFTLSKASRDLVRNLDNKLVAKAYFSKDLPPPYNNNKTYLRDQLDDYKAYSGGNFSFEFVDPGSDSVLEKQAQNYSIPPMQINSLEKDKVELKKVYMGLVFLYQDKHETLPAIQQIDGLEYDISSTIKRLTAKDRTKVAFLQGYGCPEFYREMNNLRTVLERNYEVRSITLNRNQVVPAEIDILMVVGPTEDLDDWAKFAVDQFIMRGGKVAFLLNKVSAELQTSQARPAPLRIDDWTSNYGFKINNDLVLDRKCGMINVQQRMGFFTMSNAVNYPFFPQISAFNQNSPIVKDLESMVLFFPSTIDTTLAKEKGVTITPLAFTSDNSMLQRGRYDINPMQQFNAALMKEGPFPLAATITGSFKSYFENRSVPRGDTTVPASQLTVMSDGPETRLIVIGDSHLALDTYASDPSNIAFLLNAVDWLALDEGLIQIRTRGVTNRPLAEVSEGVKTTVKYANILGPASLVILFGVIRWQIRRRRKNLEL